MAPDGAPEKEKSSMEGSKPFSGTAETSVPGEASRSEHLPLNIGQLKELLDEAFNYKNPKDREGKSQVFLDLLLEAETAEEAAGQELAAGRRRPIRPISDQSVGGGSLQNICQAVEESHNHTVGRRKNRQYKGPGSFVSARQREGGSLPCNVNTGWTSDWQNESVKRRETPSMNYDTGNTTQKSGAGSSLSGTQARRQTLLHSTSNELHNSSTSSSSSTGDKSTSEVPEYRVYQYVHDDPVAGRSTDTGFDLSDEKSLERSDRFERKFEMTPEDLVATVSGANIYYYQHIGPSTSGIDVDNNNASSSQGVYRTSASLEVADGFCDDTCLTMANGARGHDIAISRRPISKPCITSTPSLQNVESDNGSSSKASSSKKNNKRKQNAEKNVASSCRSEEMPGYRGDTDIDSVLSFIENNGKMKAMGLKKNFPKQKVQEKKEKNLQKASSLEELSQRNIEDLTQSSETDRNETRRSWGDQVFVRSESQNDISTRSNEQMQYEEDSNDSEFQMVRKKQRKRRGPECSGKRARRRNTSYRSPRRKSTSSVPPSERSADSDLDSVHSLPAHGAQASDSDCDNNGSTHLDPSDASTLTTEDFPSLPVKTEVKPEPKPKTRSKSVGPNTRPPVILLDGHRSHDEAASEYTFGFEVNMQLLSLTDIDIDKPQSKSSSNVWNTTDALTPNVTDLVQKPVIVGSNKPAIVPTCKSSSDVTPRFSQRAPLQPTKSVDASYKVSPSTPALKPYELSRKGTIQSPWKINDMPLTGKTNIIPVSASTPKTVPQPVDPSRKSASPWKSCEMLGTKSTPVSVTSDTRPSELLTPSGSNPKMPNNQSTQPNLTSAESFANVTRPYPRPLVTDTVTQSPKDISTGKDLFNKKDVNVSVMTNHYGDKGQKRFNTYIVTNHNNSKYQESVGRIPLPMPLKGDERSRGPSIGSALDTEENASLVVNDKEPVKNTKSEDERERRVSDVMTSTDDLEAVSGSKLVVNESEKQKQINVEEDDVEQGKSKRNCDDILTSNNGDDEDSSDDDQENVRRGPFVNSNHRDLVAFLQRKWEEAINDPETVWYSEN